MRCEDAAAHAADYLAGTLPDATMAAIGRHVAGCEGCRGELGALDHTWQVLGIVSSPRPRSAIMRARFDAALDGYERALEESPRRAPALPRLVPAWEWPRLGALAAGVALLLLTGAMAGRLSVSSAASPTERDELSALRREVGDMRELVSMSLMRQPSAAGRLEGVAWASRIEEPDAMVVTALLDALMHDPSVNVRLASVDALSRLTDRDSVRIGVLESLPRQTAPLVQVALIDLVLEASGVDAADVLRALSEDPEANEAVRMRAAQGLERLGGRS